MTAYVNLDNVVTIRTGKTPSDDWAVFFDTVTGYTMQRIVASEVRAHNDMESFVTRQREYRFVEVDDD
jgi:hypothetical protein